MAWQPEKRPLIIGQAPARGNDGLRPFAGQSGARLAKLAGVGEDGDALPEYFDLVNLMAKWPGKGKKGDLFNIREARENAQDIMLGVSRRPPSYILLMGRKVQATFDLKGLDYLHRYRVKRDGFEAHVVIPFPHPSGINTWWNDPGNLEAATALLKKVIGG